MRWTNVQQVVQSAECVPSFKLRAIRFAFEAAYSNFIDIMDYI